MTGNLCLPAIAEISRISAASPNRWTGMRARVREVMAASSVRGVEVVSAGIDIDEYGPCLLAGNHAGSGAEGERNGDDFIVLTDIQGHQGQQKGVRPGGATDRELAVHQLRHFATPGLRPRHRG